MADVLPTCDLLDVLRQKAQARPDTTFDYFGHLRGLRERVGGEVRSINELFPEYTPHDLEYHLSRLFHVADTLIERGRFEEMQATELFVMACGLYAHDWGMAVSTAERGYIVTGKPPAGTTAADFALLSDEAARFKRFMADHGLDANTVRASGLGDDDWREYVRQTHAFRSAERARRFFAPIDSGVAEAIARVCEGHWLDFEKLQNHTLYPTAFSVLRESLNLAALAVYVRLVDLLDIAHDRTPYVIWKFVAPRNEHSRMEWTKHRALQPVTCPPYQGGRLVRVDGSTEDHEVYAALEDLRIYCETQVRGCTDLLARLNDSRHQLDLYHVEWRVAARGFEPVPVRFEFDRERVFDILSDEIYQGDAHVFLRELLQNSIDAIHMRREFLRRGGIAPQSFGLIRVEVEHGPDGNACVMWSDNGVGMDAYIVRNYLAVAGRSFYRSDEFRRLGLQMDPISRFGIGILSCFMVADEVEIETNKDPYAPPPGEPLRIRIPSVTRQFRVEKLAPGAIEVGTRVTVRVLGRRLPEKGEGLQVTRYLKAVAGFVEFPILITEAGKHTLILHPYMDIDPASDPRFRDLDLGDSVEVHRYPLGFPLEEAILPQDLEIARAELIERPYDLRRDLHLSDVEGQITLLNFRDPAVGVSSEHIIFDGLSLRLPDQEEEMKIRWSEPWNGYLMPSHVQQAPWSRSAVSDAKCAVFHRGVLVSEARVPGLHDLSIGAGATLPARRVINLHSEHSANLNVARTEMRNDDAPWYETLRKVLDQQLVEELERTLRPLGDAQRFAALALFAGSMPVSADVLNASTASEFPVAFLSAGGRVTYRTWATIGRQPVKVCPSAFKFEIVKLLKAQITGEEYRGMLSQWVGEDVLIPPSDTASSSIAVSAAMRVTRGYLEANYHPAAVELLTPPIESQLPLWQEVWHPGGFEVDQPLAKIAAAAVNDPLEISPRARATLIAKTQILYGVRFVDFPRGAPPVLRVSELYNLAHPLAVLLLRAMAYLGLSGTRDQKSGRLSDAVQRFSRHINPGLDSVETLIQAAKQVGLNVDPGTTADLDIWHPTDMNMRWDVAQVAPFGKALHF